MIKSVRYKIRFHSMNDDIDDPCAEADDISLHILKDDGRIEMRTLGFHSDIDPDIINESQIMDDHEINTVNGFLYHIVPEIIWAIGKEMLKQDENAGEIVGVYILSMGEDAHFIILYRNDYGEINIYNAGEDPRFLQEDVEDFEANGCKIVTIIRGRISTSWEALRFGDYLPGRYDKIYVIMDNIVNDISSIKKFELDDINAAEKFVMDEEEIAYDYIYEVIVGEEVEIIRHPKFTIRWSLSNEKYLCNIGLK